jgi:hypothetical protein
MAEITDQQIADAAIAPASVTVDGTSVTNRSVGELLDAQERTSQANATKPRRGLLFSKMIPGSALGSTKSRDY